MMVFTFFFFLQLLASTTQAMDTGGGGVVIGGGGGEGGGGGGVVIGGGGSYRRSHKKPSAPHKKPSRPRGPQRCDFVNDKQYQAYLVIQKFKETITCDPKGKTDNWNGASVCKYTGFRCDRPRGSPKTPTIVAVDFNEFSLGAPTISGFVDKLPDLEFFHLNSNKLGGTLPVLSKLRHSLYEIDVSNNLMTGRYPDFAIQGLEKQLVFYDFRFNSFSGCVPGSVFNIKVKYLFLNNNHFSSPLPDNLGNTTAKYLTLANNEFTGPIPKSIRNTADTLLEIVFLNNRLSGCLPYEIGFLKKATVFDIGSNKITGTIPKSFGCLKDIEQLNLANNHLYGEVPDVVCRLPSLLNLTIAGNYFTSMPYSCKKLIAQKKLDVRNNCIPGTPKQRSRAECYKFACTHKKCPVHTYVPCKLHYDSEPAGH